MKHLLKGMRAIDIGHPHACPHRDPFGGRGIWIDRGIQPITNVDQNRRNQLVVVALADLFTLVKGAAVVGAVVVVDKRRADLHLGRNDFGRL